MEFLLQLLTTGVMVGMVYALMALGIVIIVKTTSIFNFSHGTIVGFMCFLAWSMMAQLHLPLWATAVALVGFAIILGLLIQRLIMNPLIGQPVLAAIMATLALTQVFSGLVTLLWPGPARMYPPFMPSGVIHLGTTVISYQALITFLVAMLTFAAFTLFFQRTKTGLVMRATAEDHQLARSGGIKVTSIFAMAWIIAILSCSIGGVLLGSMHGVNFEPVSGLAYKALPAVMIGGMESIGGAVLGGILIGVAENVGAGFLDPLVGGGLADVLPFVVMLIFVIVMPYGLFGHRRIERI